MPTFKPKDSLAETAQKIAAAWHLAEVLRTCDRMHPPLMCEWERALWAAVELQKAFDAALDVALETVRNNRGDAIGYSAASTKAYDILANFRASTDPPFQDKAAKLYSESDVAACLADCLSAAFEQVEPVFDRIAKLIEERKTGMQIFNHEGEDR